jgi:hypothetical protein
MNVFVPAITPASPMWSSETIQNIPAFRIQNVRINVDLNAFSANNASLMGAEMVQSRVMTDVGFQAFKIGLAISLIAIVLWAATIATGYIIAAVIFAMIGTFGAFIILVGVLEGRRREIYHD